MSTEDTNSPSVGPLQQSCQICTHSLTSTIFLSLSPWIPLKIQPFHSLYFSAICISVILFFYSDVIWNLNAVFNILWGKESSNLWGNIHEGQCMQIFGRKAWRKAETWKNWTQIGGGCSMDTRGRRNANRFILIGTRDGLLGTWRWVLELSARDVCLRKRNGWYI